MTEQIALRFPEGTRDRIKALARDGESMTAVVQRALGALEGLGATHDIEDTRPHRDMRLSALERLGSTSKPDSSEPGDGAEYPVESKDMALGMQVR